MTLIFFVTLGKKGGELASVVHSFMKHGDPNLQSLTNKILSQAGLFVLDRICSTMNDGSSC